MFRRLHLPIRHYSLSATLGAAVCAPLLFYTIQHHSLEGQVDEQGDRINRQRLAHEPARMSTTTTTTTASTTTSPPNKLSTPYTANVSVPMHCDSCTTEISAALSSLSGIHTTTFSLPEQLLTITGTTPPSHIITTIQSKTGRTAILRGSGKPDSAAVCILETPISSHPPNSASSQNHQQGATSPIRGLARLLELSDQITMLDLTLTNLLPGTYTASVRTTGDISRGLDSVGGVWQGFNEDKPGQLGTVEVKEDGTVGWVGELEGWRVWELVGRGVVVERVGDNSAEGRGDQVVIGVVARSAGVWENEKMVCACSGKTVWEERKEMMEKGML